MCSGETVHTQQVKEKLMVDGAWRALNGNGFVSATRSLGRGYRSLCSDRQK